YSKNIINIMKDMVENIDKYSNQQLFNRINKVLGLINEIKNDPEKKVRNYIHDAIRATKQSERNYREHVKSKFEMIISTISEMLEAMASWLESPDNEAILLAEYDEECLKVVAQSCIEASAALKRAAEHVDIIEPAAESVLTPESLEGLANIAAAFDNSDDEN